MKRVLLLCCVLAGCDQQPWVMCHMPDGTVSYYGPYLEEKYWGFYVAMPGGGKMLFERCEKREAT